MQYHHEKIEKKWQQFWQQNQTFKAQNNSEKEKFYVLDMFPYPSGAGLHVGHPLGYIASDIFSRYKRLKGFNVLHPIGYDSFGLPAEQYAIQTGQHPTITTKVNIEGGTDKQGNQITGYENQLKKLGFSFDWNREFRTSDPSYYKWTQWIFIQLFNSYYCKKTNQAKTIHELINVFEQEGNKNTNAETSYNETFTAEEWNSLSEKEKQSILLNYRLTYLAEAEVNWCPALGTVLANDEVIHGASERGGHPVIRKKMTQWMMRIGAYAERLLQDLEKLDWSEPLKESQRNWIGKSKGASVKFGICNDFIEVFTTRPDTIFGVTFITLAPEHPLVDSITTEEYKTAVNQYKEATAKRSERERMADVKTISGQFTGAYAVHPFTQEEIPIWIGDYVLGSYGTGAVMAVPAGDERDYAFANHFNLPIKNIFDKDISTEAFTAKNGFMLKNSDFLNELDYKQATHTIISAIEEKNVGQGKINYRLRDAVFSRQRYWGEPVPAYFKEGIPYMLPESSLPLILPEIDEYLPTETGEPPLGRATHWAWDTEKQQVVANDLIDEKRVFPLELNTMPGWAGSSWYFNRYMDTHNEAELASKEALDYWKEVDLYIGGSEHATGHLLYARFWQKFLFDKGIVPVDEFAKKLINQGMILGNSAFVYRVSAIGLSSTDFIYSTNIYLSKSIYDYLKRENKLSDNKYIELAKSEMARRGVEVSSINNVLGIICDEIHSDISFINSSDELDIEAFKDWRTEFNDAVFIGEKGEVINDDNDVYKVGREVEKMSKSKYNVVNPDDICEEYGADALRMYEMFLGPLEQSKPWNTQGLSGVYSFLKKFWRLYHTENSFAVSDETPTKEEMKILHQTIKKVDEDIQNFSFNTSVSTFMITTNELAKLKCNKRSVLKPLVVLISPYAPHIAEELWEKFGHSESISFADFPTFDEKWLVESEKEYPVSFNGKTRFMLSLPLDLSKEEIEKIVLADDRTQKQLAGKTPKKIIIVPGKIINLVG